VRSWSFELSERHAQGVERLNAALVSRTLARYGLGRFPVTLYQEQWQKLLGMADEIKAFIAENKDRLKAKEN
jgi:hypothetical protein